MYWYYKVNNKIFLNYKKAQKARKTTKGNVTFKGLHFIRGWECFYIYVEAPKFEDIPLKIQIERCKRYYEK